MPPFSQLFILPTNFLYLPFSQLFILSNSFFYSLRHFSIPPNLFSIIFLYLYQKVKIHTSFFSFKYRTQNTIHHFLICENTKWNHVQVIYKPILYKTIYYNHYYWVVWHSQKYLLSTLNVSTSQCAKNKKECKTRRQCEMPLTPTDAICQASIHWK